MCNNKLALSGRLAPAATRRGARLLTRFLASLSASLLGCLLLMAMMGCREHPRVTSRASLDLIKQVYTACNTHNPERLAKCKEEIDALTQSGQLSAAEQESFQQIMALADAGDWQAATSESLQFARDQVQ